VAAFAPLLARGEIEVIWLIVMVLIALGSFIKGLIQRYLRAQKKAEEGEEPPEPITEQVRTELRKYLGEIQHKAPEETPAPAPKPLPTPPPKTETPIPRPLPVEKRKRPKRRIERRPTAASKRPKKPKIPVDIPEPVLAIRGRENLRKAILYREILGPPVGLRNRPGLTRLSRR
jgi:hypothetical protein